MINRLFNAFIDTLLVVMMLALVLGITWAMSKVVSGDSAIAVDVIVLFFINYIRQEE